MISEPKNRSPLKTGMANLSTIGGEYPKMLFRKTDEEQRYVQTTHADGEPKTWLVTNRFNGLLCETVVVDSVDDAETLTADGWDTSPEAAHGIVQGLAAVTSAKDDRIAELEAMLAAQAPRRGRPPRQPDEIEPVE